MYLCGKNIFPFKVWKGMRNFTTASNAIKRRATGKYDND